LAFLTKIKALAAVAAMLLAAGSSRADVDAQTGLIINPGWELVRAHCGGCHSYKLITAQRADRNNWLDTIRWMQATQNLWQFDAATEAGILDYLAENYAPQANQRRAPIPSSLLPPRNTATR
jgi:hypothetical protein